jgi:hypothetical protein
LQVDWKSILQRKGKEVGIEFKDCRTHADVVEKMDGILNRVSYLYMSLPDGQSLIGIGKMPFTFPREVICEGLGTPDRVDWKSCQIDEKAETKTVQELKESLPSSTDQSSEQGS